MITTWNQNTPGIFDSAERGDGFGTTLAVGNFNGGKFDDLAIGVPFEDIGTREEAGVVHILRGSQLGISSNAAQYVHQGITGTAIVENDDLFGSALISGNFNGDLYDDLAIGVSQEGIGTISQAGAVQVFQGSTSGLIFSPSQLWHQNSNKIDDSSEKGDRFGSYLASGDFNNDRFDDLAVGIPFEDIGQVASAGAISILRGSESGLTANSDQFLHQNSSGIEGDAEAGDLFGATLAVGDFNGDRYDDLAVGAFLEDVGNIRDAGVVHVLQGSNSGLIAPGNELWYQDKNGVQGVSEAGDLFGSDLASGDFNNDGYDDLVVQASGENDGDGIVHIFWGSSNGLSTLNDVILYFSGGNMAVGDFNGDSYDDLVLSNQTDDPEQPTNINIVFGSGSKSRLGHDFLPINIPWKTSSMFAGDFNGDSMDDLVLGHPSENVGIIGEAGFVSIMLGGI